MEIFGHTKKWCFVHEMVYDIFLNCEGTILICTFCTSFTQKTHIAANKMKNELFMPRKGKQPKSTLFAIPRCTHVHNMGLFEQTMPWLWP
jgi:hypothetical protein